MENDNTKTEFKKVPFYYHPIFLIILSALSFLHGIPLIIALILLYLRSKKYKLADTHDLLALHDINNKIVNASRELHELKAAYQSEEEKLNKRYQEQFQKLKAEYAKEMKDLDDIKRAADKFMSTPESDISIYENISSSEIRNQLSILMTKEKGLQSDDKAIYVISKNAERKISELRKQKNQLLRSFNNETDSLIRDTTVKNIDTIRQKISRSFEAHNKLFAIDGVQLTSDFLKSKLDRMSCFYEYQKKVKEEKEIFNAQKEQLKEEEKVRRELDAAKKKIEKDEAQYNNEINRMMKYMQNTSLDAEKKLYLDKIQELNEKLEVLGREKENISQREANAKAGFIYIISNIGSFGENIYKIGMTRRLEPMDRIKELSSASVPFEFDVHALIFSDDAPALESLLHQHFRNLEVNKVNHRKEFFKVKLAEIEQLVKEQYNNTVSFTESPKAEEYYETLKLSQELP